MKVLLSAYSCRPFFGSEAGIGWNWAIEISNRGHQVWVITRENNKKDIEKYFTEHGFAKNINFIYYDLPFLLVSLKKVMTVYLYYEFWQRGIVALAKELDNKYSFDIVHHVTLGVFRQNTFLYKLNKPLYIGPLGGGETMPKSIVKSFPIKFRIFEWVRSFSNNLALKNPYLIKSFSHSSRIYCKTQETRNLIPIQFQYKTCISNDIGTSNFHNESFTGLNEKPDDFEFLFVGRLLHWKGAHLAVLAFTQFVAKYYKSRLTIIGSGSYKGELLKFINENQYKDKISLIENIKQTQVFDYYSKAHVFLFPTLHDSSGSVIYEAMSYALPIVSLKMNGPAFILGSDCKTLITIKDKDTPFSIANKLMLQMEKLYLDKDYFNAMSNEMKAKALNFKWNNIVDFVYTDIETSVNVN